MPQTIDQQLNSGLQLRGMSVEVFAKLAVLFDIPKASKAKLYEAFRGGKALDNETALRLWKLWVRVEDLVERAAPFKISLENAESVKITLDLLDIGVDLAVGARSTNGPDVEVDVIEQNQGA
jgi:hypothetical protein